MSAEAEIDHRSTLRLVGPIDGSSSARVRDQVYETIAASEGDVVLDASQVEWIDITGLAMIAGAHRVLEAQHRRLVLSGCSPRLLRALAVTHLTRVIAVERIRPVPEA